MADETKTINLVRDHYNACKGRRGTLEEQWNKNYQAYRRIHDDDKSESGLANYYIPEAYTAIETVLVRLVSPFLNLNKPWFTVTAKKPEYVANAKATEGLLLNQFYDEKMGRKIENLYKQAIIYGISFGKVYWDRIEKQKKRWALAPQVDELTGLPQVDPMGEPVLGYEEQEYTSVERNQPCLEIVSPHDIFIDPSAESLNVYYDDCRFLIHKKLMSRKQIVALAEQGVYDMEVVNELPEEGEGDDEPSKKEDFSHTDYSDQSFSTNRERKFEVLDHWEEDRVITVADDKYLLRDVENPYWHKKIPFFAVTYSDHINEIWADGLPELIQDLQEQLNDVTNSRLNNVKLNLNSMFMMEYGALENENECKMRPGGILHITTGSMDKIKPLPIQDMSSITYPEQQSILQAIQNTTGATEYVRGTQQDIGKQTATEVNSKMQSAGSRFEYQFKKMGEQLLAVPEFYVELNRQFITEEVTVRVPEEQGQFGIVRPEDMEGEFDFMFTIDPLGSEQQQKRENLMLVTQLATSPMFMPYIRPKPLLDMLLDSIDIKSEEITIPEEIVNAPQQLQQQIAMGGVPNPGAGGLPGGMPPVPGMAEGLPAPA